MVKRFLFVIVVLAFLIPVITSGCGGGADPQPAADRTPAAERGEDSRIPDGIPVYPKARQIDMEEHARFFEHGANVYAYETDDSLSRVYSFYSNELEEGGFDAPGSMSIGNGSHFVFQVSKDGSEVAMINGTVEEGRTYIVIIGL